MQAAGRPDPVHRHDVGRPPARDRTALDDRRYRHEAFGIRATKGRGELEHRSELQPVALSQVGMIGGIAPAGGP
jgi:hypothetical protein